MKQNNKYTSTRNTVLNYNFLCLSQISSNNKTNHIIFYENDTLPENYNIYYYFCLKLKTLVIAFSRKTYSRCRTKSKSAVHIISHLQICWNKIGKDSCIW